ncbi:hypothetical protein ABZW10_32940 [Kitasatospora sp. NPDC004723]|uniref:hypothetical protein n=1 Tax=Kitasatospora sp. NPDC004723 TaxID=3154288 RepID=UPI0033B7529B
MSRGRAAGIKEHRRRLSAEQAVALVLAANDFDDAPAEQSVDSETRCERLRAAHGVRLSARLDRSHPAALPVGSPRFAHLPTLSEVTT